MTAPLEATIRVKVLPRSSKNAVVGRHNGSYRIKLTAPAVEGKANKALFQLVSKKLDVPKRNLHIVSGQYARHKSIRIEGLSAQAVDWLLLPGS